MTVSVLVQDARHGGFLHTDGLAAVRQELSVLRTIYRRGEALEPLAVAAAEQPEAVSSDAASDDSAQRLLLVPLLPVRSLWGVDLYRKRDLPSLGRLRLLYDRWRLCKSCLRRCWRCLSLEHSAGCTPVVEHHHHTGGLYMLACCSATKLRFSSGRIHFDL